MILIKLGGSIITNKSRKTSPRKKAIDAIAKTLAGIREPIILVHGGGSYGHYWSVKYDMHTKPEKYDIAGVAKVKNSMVELDKIILDALEKNANHPYCVQPACFMNTDKPMRNKIKEIGEISKTGMIPVTYGDALWYGKKTYILSGDSIMGHVAKVLRPRLCIFAMDVDGLLNSPNGELIREYSQQAPSIPDSDKDVTGGMVRKVKEAKRISQYGIRVFFVNGNKPDRITKAIKDSKFHGTIFRGKRRV